MLYTQHFIIEGAYLGSALRNKQIVHAELHSPRPFAFFCGSCAELWARCPVDNLGPGDRQEWMVWRRPCRRCAGHIGEIPGSLLLPWDEDFNNCLAEVPDALRWEFQQHLTFAEKAFAL